MSPDAALAVCRFLHDTSLMLFWGASAYLSTLVPRNLAKDVGRRLRSFGAVAVVLAIATAVLALPLEGAVIGDGWPDALDPTTIRDVLIETSVGYAWQAQTIAVLVLITALAVPWRGRRLAIPLAAGLLLASLALTGHAVMQDGWLGAAHQANDAVHLLSAGAWLGALVPLLFILRALDDPERRGEAGVALRRFSGVGHTTVALVIASGVINTALVLGRWPVDCSSPYQAMLASKLILVGIMVALAIVNRYGFVRRMSGDRTGALRALRLGASAEIILGLCVVGLVSVFGTLEPT